MLLRSDPFRELDRLTQSLAGSRSLVMPIDAYRRGDRFIVHFDVPGIDPESLELTVEKDVLSVRAERGWQPNEGDEVLVSERPQGAFTRQLFLGDGLDADHIEARYDNGVLTVTVPVAEQAKPRKVAISSGRGGAEVIEASSTAA
ncbi:MAG: Hsp20/alpha crystallin family protein [Actinomycetota bacterium]|nr:Hsp20/alpha crystallin family protein [Actinomycetota bacterium]